MNKSKVPPKSRLTVTRAFRAVGLLVAAIVRPRLLQPLNRVWFKIGMLLHHVVTPVVMGLIFVLGVLPSALIMRMPGMDPLRLDPRRGAKTNWVVDSVVFYDKPFLKFERPPMHHVARRSASISALRAAGSVLRWSSHPSAFCSA